MSKETLEQALEAFTIVRFCVPPAQRPTIERAIAATIEALAKQEQCEPVAWELGAEVYWGDSPEMSDYVRKEGTPLFTTPQQRKPLTDEHIWQLVNNSTIGGDLHADKFARAIEAAHGIKE